MSESSTKITHEEVLQKALPLNPDDLGQAEYRLIYDFCNGLVEQSFDVDEPIAVCEEALATSLEELRDIADRALHKLKGHEVSHAKKIRMTSNSMVHMPGVYVHWMAAAKSGDSEWAFWAIATAFPSLPATMVADILAKRCEPTQEGDDLVFHWPGPGSYDTYYKRKTPPDEDDEQ